MHQLLTALLNDHQLFDVRTMLAGAQGILNTWLLTAINNSVNDYDAIMPLNFITNTTDTSAMNPITNLSSHGKLIASHTRIQARVDHFWGWWMWEYLPNLQKSHKEIMKC